MCELSAEEIEIIVVTNILKMNHNKQLSFARIDKNMKYVIIKSIKQLGMNLTYMINSSDDLRSINEADVTVGFKN